jgi:Pyridoxamine 5'-phosphate oxidase
VRALYGPAEIRLTGHDDNREAAAMTDTKLEPLSQDECLLHLRQGSVGRIAFVLDDDPVILPVNYRLVEPESGPLLAVRTRPGNVIEQAATNVAFEIDSIDHVHHEGWSVLVRGELLHATPTSHDFMVQYDPTPWLADRDAWLLIDPWAISGRKLQGTEPVWPFHPGDYL